MRAIGLIVATALIASSAAAAAWKEYPQPQLGFVVEFPADPAASTGSYKTTLVPSATTHIYSVKEDQALYVATVVDLLDRKEEGATLLGEAESMMTQLGDVIPDELKSRRRRLDFPRLPAALQGLFAIAWLTWKAAFRFRLFLVVAVLLLGAVIGLPLLIKDDGTARGFTQILLTYKIGRAHV